VTIFSAPNYEGTKSSGSYIVLNPSLNNNDDEFIIVSDDIKYKVMNFEKYIQKESLKYLE